MVKVGVLLVLACAAARTPAYARSTRATWSPATTAQPILMTCDRCRGTCDSLKHTLALCRTAGPLVQVPTSVQASVRVALRNFLAENA